MIGKPTSYRLAIVWLISVVMVVVSIFPFVWMILTSLQDDKDLFAGGFHYLPRRLTLDNYRTLFSTTPIARHFLNSAIVASLSTLLGLFVAVNAAYAFSRFLFPGRRALMTLFLVIPMFPAVLILIPLFIILRNLQLIGSYWALLIAYTTFVIPFTVWMLTGFFDSIPADLEEASMLDGSTRLGAVFRVLVPIAMPGIASTAIYIFIVAWNEFLYALMFTSNDTRTLPVGLYTFIGQFDIRWGLLTAGGTVVTIPLITLFFFIQGQLVRGLTAGAIRG